MQCGPAAWAGHALGHLLLDILHLSSGGHHMRFFARLTQHCAPTRWCHPCRELLGLLEDCTEELVLEYSCG